MADFDAAGADESEMFGPEFGADLVEEASHLIESLVFDGSGRGEAEANAVEYYGNLIGERFESADLAARR